ncbi:MAG: hypothetical protein Q8M26_05240 [Pseudolabrys sp.]|nr:hypothetical protein [Pseudolabrys sp.]
MGRKPIIWFGSIGLIAIAGYFLIGMVFEPSENDARAFLQKLLRADGRVHARGADGAVIRLDAARIVRIDAARCRPDRDDARYRGRYNQIVAHRFVCRYTVVTSGDARFETVLRANRVPPGGPAEKSVPGSLVDPSRYREGYFILSPVGLKEAEALLGSAATGD